MKPGYHSGKLVFGKNEPIGKRIRKARVWYGLTQDELAVLALVSKATISGMETGQDFYMSTLMLMCQGLDLPIERLVANLPEIRR